MGQPHGPAAEYNTNPVLFYRVGGRNTRPVGIDSEKH